MFSLQYWLWIPQLAKNCHKLLQEIAKCCQITSGLIKRRICTLLNLQLLLGATANSNCLFLRCPCWAIFEFADLISQCSCFANDTFTYIGLLLLTFCPQNALAQRDRQTRKLLQPYFCVSYSKHFFSFCSQAASTGWGFGYYLGNYKATQKTENFNLQIIQSLFLLSHKHLLMSQK